MGTNHTAYPLVEDFYSLQGEGYHSGHPAYFIRLAGCPVRCDFCDSKQTWNIEGFPMVEAAELANRAVCSGAKTVVVTGGEPLIHNLDALCQALHERGLACWLETSGSQPLSGQWDWICLSPKPHAPLHAAFRRTANELKVVISSPADFRFAEQCAQFFEPAPKAESAALQEASPVLLYLQCDWNQTSVLQSLIIDYIQQHPQWRLSLQTHKYLNIR